MQQHTDVWNFSFAAKVLKYDHKSIIETTEHYLNKREEFVNTLKTNRTKHLNLLFNPLENEQVVQNGFKEYIATSKPNIFSFVTKDNARQKKNVKFSQGSTFTVRTACCNNLLEFFAIEVHR